MNQLTTVPCGGGAKNIYAVHADDLNRPVMLTDAAKVNVWSASFEPFGKVRTVNGALTQNLGLPGQWFQLEHGRHAAHFAYGLPRAKM